MSTILHDKDYERDLDIAKDLVSELWVEPQDKDVWLKILPWVSVIMGAIELLLIVLILVFKH